MFQASHLKFSFIPSIEIFYLLIVYLSFSVIIKLKVDICLFVLASSTVILSSC